MNLQVYFACHDCGATYRALQVQVPQRAFGRFECETCQSTVHTWSGIYDFFSWKHMLPTRSHRGDPALRPVLPK